MNQNKTILITGATSGIGKALATGLSRHGYQLILIYRNLEKAEKVRREILGQNDKSHIELMYCDLSKLETVNQLCSQLLNKKIDIICNCAGALFTKRTLTQDGFESNFVVNYLASFLLTTKFLNSQPNYPTTIINLSGELHRFFKMDLDDLQYQKSFHFIKAGAISMLQRIMFTKSLIRHYPHTNAYSYHPGRINTGLLDELPVYLKYPAKLASPFLSKSSVGADTAIWLTKKDPQTLVNGAYYIKRLEKKPSHYALNSQAGEQLWEKSMELLAPYY